ncbi:MAG: agmatinase [Acidimicrobiales bacterium]
MSEERNGVDLSDLPPEVAEFYHVASAKLEGVPMAGGELTFKGIERTKDFEGADIAVVGCPYDLGTTHRPGARFGPRAVRELSKFVGAWPTGVWPWHFDVSDEYRMIDWGDVPYKVGYWDSFRDSCTEAVTPMHEAGVSVFGLGGDHYVTYPLMKAAAEQHGPLALVHFDAHSDDIPAPAHNHGTMFFHGVLEGWIVPDKSLHLGIRAPYDFSTALGYTVLDGIHIHDMSAAEIAAEVKRVVGDHPTYLTFDIDFLDPAFAPATGTPVPGGPDVYKSRAILFEMDALGMNVVSGDVVEVAPHYEGPAQITALAAANIAADVCHLIAHSRREPPPRPT